MRVPVRPAVAFALAAAALAAPAAQAGFGCYGPSSHYVCVTTPGVKWTSTPYCIYTGGTSCTTYNVPGVTTTGSLAVDCGGPNWRCHV